MTALNFVCFSIHSVTEIIFSVFLKFLKFLFPLLIIPRLELYIFTFEPLFTKGGLNFQSTQCRYKEPVLGKPPHVGTGTMKDVWENSDYFKQIFPWQVGLCVIGLPIPISLSLFTYALFLEGFLEASSHCSLSEFFQLPSIFLLSHYERYIHCRNVRKYRRLNILKENYPILSLSTNIVNVLMCLLLVFFFFLIF